MKTFRISFYECEHEGDLNHYLSDITASGGRVKDSSLNYDSESAVVTVEVDDPAAFKAKFANTESYDFSSLASF